MFCNPKSPSAPAKLRLLYECAPLALIVEVRSDAISAATWRGVVWCAVAAAGHDTPIEVSRESFEGEL